MHEPAGKGSTSLIILRFDTSLEVQTLTVGQAKDGQGLVPKSTGT